MWIPDRGREGRGQVPATSPAHKGAGRGDAGVLGGYSRNFTLSVVSGRLDLRDLDNKKSAPEYTCSRTTDRMSGMRRNHNSRGDGYE